MRLSHLLRPLSLALLLYVSALCLLRSGGYFERIADDDPARFAPMPSVVVSGRVASLSVEKRDRQEFVLKARTIDGNPVRGRLLVRLKGPDELDWGDEVLLAGRLALPPPSPVPGEAGWRGHLALQRMHAIVWADSVRDRVAAAPWLLRMVGAYRRSMLASFKDRLEPERAAILSGVVLGEKSALPRESNEAFRDAGAIHLLVASGSNVTFVLLGVAALFGVFGLSRGPAVAAGLVASGLYTLAAGADAPLLRAYTMTSAGAAGFLLGRDSGAFQALILAAWALLLAEPRALFQPGFQMSFAATFGIVVAISHWPVPRRWPRLSRSAAQILLVSVAAQLAVSPFLAEHFHRLSLAAVVSNLLLVPMAAALMAGGFALHVASLLPWPAPADLTASVVSTGLGLFEWTVRAFAALPFASFWVPSPSVWFHAAYACLALAALSATEGRKAAAVACSGLGVALLGAMASLFPGPLRVSAFPGGAMLVQAPDGRLLLIDAGARGIDLAHGVLSAGSRSVDELRLTSLSPKAWKGLEGLLDLLRVRTLVVPPGPLDPGLERLAGRVEILRQEGSGRYEFGPLELVSSGRNLAFEWRGLVGTAGGRRPSLDGPFDTMAGIERTPKPPWRLTFDGGPPVLIK